MSSSTILTIDAKKLKRQFDKNCNGSIVGSESSLHQLAPYIGKIKSSIAKFLIENFTKPGDMILDPFCGAGTIPFEGWVLNRSVYANDLNKYAYILTVAKLFPPGSLEELNEKIEKFDNEVKLRKDKIDLRKVPSWVKSFFHKETLRETLTWFTLLEERQEWFLTACLLGILHHQRPGFLSFPSSHTVPYLRLNKFPINTYPELYEYRNVRERLLKKAKRAFKKVPDLDRSILRQCSNLDASNLIFKLPFDAIISSPPYMRKLDYARDNRLRLWFLGIDQVKLLDEQISPKENDFITMMTQCINNWRASIKEGGKCILFLGDSYSKKYKMSLPDLIENIAVEQIGGFKLLFRHNSLIPDNRRVRRNHSGNRMETVLVFEKTGSKLIKTHFRL